MCATSLFPKISCVRSSDLSPIISDQSDTLFSSCTMMIDSVSFDCYNHLYVVQYDLIFYIYTTLLAPLRSNLIDIILSALFSIFVHSASIGAAHYSQLCLVRSTHYTAYMIISYLSTHDTICLIFSVLMAWIRFYCFISVWFSLINSDMSSSPLKLLTSLLKITIRFHLTFF